MPRGGTGPWKWSVLWYFCSVGRERLVADIRLPRALGGAPQIQSDFGFRQRWRLLSCSSGSWHRDVCRCYQHFGFFEDEGNVGNWHHIAQCHNTVKVTRRWVLLEKLVVPQLLKKFPTFYGHRKFITVITVSRHLSLSWTSFIQSVLPSYLRSILILSSHLRRGLPSGLTPSGDNDIKLLKITKKII